MNPAQYSRRQFLKSTTALSAGLWLGGSTAVRATSPSEKLNVACIGVGGRGSANVGGVSGENIVAMCDVDENKAGKRFQQFDKAGRFQDFRVMFDKAGSHPLPCSSPGDVDGQACVLRKTTRPLRMGMS